MKKTALLFLMMCALAHISQANKQDSVGVTKINGKFHIRYMISPGETIYRISTRYKVSVSDLIDINPELEFGLKTGQILSIPYNPEGRIAIPPNNEEETLGRIAIRPNNEEALSGRIAIRPNNEEALSGRIAIRPNSDSLTENGVVHTIQTGETYSSIAKKYNISVEDLLKINKVELKAGQKVVVNERLKAIKKEQKTENKEQRAESKEQRTENKEQRAESKEKRIESKEQRAENKEQRGETSGQQTTNPEQPIAYDNAKKNLLVVPFDPYLYFSDADDEIASVSKMQRTKVRQAFRRRLSALLEPKGYEITNLLGGKAKDSITDLNKIYSSVNYSYQDILINQNVRIEKQADKGLGKEKKQSSLVNVGDNSRAAQAQDAKKYFGVKIANPEFFTFFNNKYKIDYYLFINQFEVKTNYENCLDRATLNYERGFTIHYSIFDKNGKQIAGNRIYVDYNSNTNNISKILADNMQKVADKIMADLPPAE